MYIDQLNAAHVMITQIGNVDYHEVGIPRKLGQDNVLLLADRYVDFLNKTSVVLLYAIVPEGN